MSDQRSSTSVWSPKQCTSALLIAALAMVPLCLDAKPLGLAAKPADKEPHVAVALAGAPGGGMIIQKNVMVKMRDGVRLATDIYRPGGDGRHPVVLVRTPYASETPEIIERAKYYVKQGYAFVVQDCRGKNDSQGDWNGKRNEAEDGSDAITWLGTRPWSTGRVGMTGGSYLGAVQYQVADQENPYLKALVPMVAPLTLGRDLADYDRLAVYSGRDSLSINTMWMIGVDGRVNQNDRGSAVFDEAWDHLPRIDYPKIFGREMQWWPFVLNHRYGFWEEYFLRAARGEWSKPIPDTWWKNYEQRYRKVRVPMLHISGWYDCCGEQMTKTFQLVRQYAAEPLARNNQQLVMGPWYHQVGRADGGELDFGPDAQLNPDEASVRWFDRWLKTDGTGGEKQPAVRVFVMGENRWREADDWPIPGTQFTKFYLHSTGRANLAQGGGSLSNEAPGDEPVDRYTYDPGNPTPIPTKSLSGPVDMTGVQMRDDVLVYTSEVLSEPIEVTGPLAAVLYVATTAPSTDLLVRLIDVHPDGKAYSTFNAGTPPYRTHWAKEVQSAPDGTRIIKADIMLYPTSVLFRVGHRIRVEVSSSFMVDDKSVGLPKYGARGLNVEPGTEPYATQWNVAKQTIYHGTAHPSHILLPIIPR